MKRLLFLCAVVMFFSCSKDSSNSKPAITMETLAGDYKITSATADVGGSQQDVLDLYLPSCQRDNIYHLKADGTFTVTDDGEVCDPSSATSGNWTLSGNNVSIGTLDFTITNFDGKAINGTTTYSVTDPIPATLSLKVVFTKQ